MHGGGQLLRRWLMTARPWQRLLVATLMVGAGALLVALGNIRAGLIGVAGLLLLFAMARNTLRSRKPSRTTSLARTEQS